MKTKESVLRQMLLEIALGVDQTANTNGKDDKDLKIARDGIVPITPSLETPIQLSSQLPNITDPEFVPSNKFELARAMSSMAELVPEDLVEEFYNSMKEKFKEIVGEEIV
jgi:hypothetical protein